MWTAIEALAKPFKLTALPAELRNQIYREVLEPVRRVSITQWSRYQSATPSLMHACQQIRSECAFIHYAETAFTGHTLIRYGTHSGKPVLTDGMVRNWIMDVAQPFWRHLRHFSIAIIENIGGYVNSFNLELHYDDGEGEGRLVAILPQDLNEDWKSKIFDHIKDINKAADAGGWAGGERIVGAIMTRREVWMPRQYAELD
ncbi:hypothetical protein HII31_07803 [Pseudocercospora fuligena]|uniref:2EXR domain-containing protein n=1 Tax=Pseudocercospora fuligena TaxID=685502 RepID=A0A8H6RFL4_9PEZI|nr:hypothetical protein HII31_07803 [Pseudocercospora fuligena]